MFWQGKLILKLFAGFVDAQNKEILSVGINKKLEAFEKMRIEKTTIVIIIVKNESSAKKNFSFASRIRSTAQIKLFWVTNYETKENILLLIVNL